LFELLVVIAILGILAALLFSAVARGKKRSRRVACVNNLKQIGTALRAYAGDHNMHLPSYGGNAAGDWDSALTNGYLTAKNFRCPSDRAARPQGVLPRTYGISVGTMDGSVAIDGSRLNCPSFVNPSEIVIVTERHVPGNPGGVGNGVHRTSNGGVGVVSAHFPYKAAPEYRTNYLFLDGHVAWQECLISNNFPFTGGKLCP
jgi:prepilin-type processing-associated H-X9-DG protein